MWSHTGALLTQRSAVHEKDGIAKFSISMFSTWSWLGGNARDRYFLVAFIWIKVLHGCSSFVAFFFPKNTVYVRFLVARKIDFVCAQISSDYLQMTMMSTVCKGEGDLEVVCMVLLFKRWWFMIYFEGDIFFFPGGEWVGLLFIYFIYIFIWLWCLLLLLLIFLSVCSWHAF